MKATCQQTGEHSVTAADKQAEKASQDDLVALSSKAEAIPGGECLAEREAALIMDTITGLKAVKADNALKGVPGCKYLLDKRITDLERCKEGLEKGPSMGTLACLHQNLRLERLLHINERDIARAKLNKEKKKKKKDMKKLLNAKWKKRLWNRKMDIQAAKLQLQKEGACFTPDELGNCPPKIEAPFKSEELQGTDGLSRTCTPDVATFARGV